MSDYTVNVNVNMLALLVCEYLRSHIAELNAPDYRSANHTQRILLHLAKSYKVGLRYETELHRYIDGEEKRFDLAYLDNTGRVVMLMEDEDVSTQFLTDELPKLVKGQAPLKVGVTYDSNQKERGKIVEETAKALKQAKGESRFLLILGYIQDTKRDEPYIRFDSFLLDNHGNLVWKDEDRCNRKVNLR